MQLKSPSPLNSSFSVVLNPHFRHSCHHLQSPPIYHRRCLHCRLFLLRQLLVSGQTGCTVLLDCNGFTITEVCWARTQRGTVSPPIVQWAKPLLAFQSHAQTAQRSVSVMWSSSSPWFCLFNCTLVFPNPTTGNGFTLCCTCCWPAC